MAKILELDVPGPSAAVRIRVASTWTARAIGLLATPRLDDPCGLWIKPCNSIHTFWMRYPIDLVFIGRDGVVTKVVRDLVPWRMAGCRRARTTLELRAGLARELGIAPGTALPALRS